MKKPRESKMLAEVRRWREEAHKADKAKTPAKRAEEAEELAQRLELPLSNTSKTEDNQQG